MFTKQVISYLIVPCMNAYINRPSVCVCVQDTEPDFDAVDTSAVDALNTRFAARGGEECEQESQATKLDKGYICSQKQAKPNGVHITPFEPSLLKGFVLLYAALGRRCLQRTISRSSATAFSQGWPNSDL